MLRQVISDIFEHTMSTYIPGDDPVEGGEGNKKISADLAIDSISQVIQREDLCTLYTLQKEMKYLKLATSSHRAQGTLDN